MSELLKEDVKQQVRDVFTGLPHPVQILFFGSQSNCDYCNDTRQLLGEVVALSPSLGLTVFDLEADSATAKQYRVDKAPVFVVAARDSDVLTDTGIQYAGVPSGHEFTTLIQDIVLVASRDSGLKETTREFLKTLQTPIHLQVFVTPTCPYCPAAVRLAHKMALESDLVRADMIEATEFPEMAEKYNVMGVPRVVINDSRYFEGALPEAQFLQAALQALEETAAPAESAGQ